MAKEIDQKDTDPKSTDPKEVIENADIKEFRERLANVENEQKTSKGMLEEIKNILSIKPLKKEEPKKENFGTLIKDILEELDNAFYDEQK